MGGLKTGAEREYLYEVTYMRKDQCHLPLEKYNAVTSELEVQDLLFVLGTVFEQLNLSNITSVRQSLIYLMVQKPFLHNFFLDAAKNMVCTNVNF